MYVEKVGYLGEWAGFVEVIAMEVLDRPITIYDADPKQSGLHRLHKQSADEIDICAGPPIRLSYHGNHYNALVEKRDEFPLGFRNSSNLLYHRLQKFSEGR